MKTIGLCMIVKNEAHVIQRCLQSVLPLIDYILIVDTGSSDGTPGLIANFLGEQQLPGVVLHEPWRDFAFNRSQALQKLRAQHAIDYALMLDADEVLVFEPGFEAQAFKQSLNLDLYDIETRYGGIRYLRPQLCSNRLPFCYKGVLHEYLEGTDGQSRGRASGFYNHPLQDSARAHNPHKFQDDARVLESALAMETDAFLISRYNFYLAQSYRDAGELQLALEAYQRRTQQGFWQEEVYVSWLQVGRLLGHLGYSAEAQFQAYWAAYECLPTRLEALHDMVRLCRLQQRYHQGYILGQYGLTLPAPSQGLFIEPWIAEYGLLDEFSIVAYWAGHYQASLSACQQLLQDDKVPADYRQRILDNANFALTKLQPPAALPAQPDQNPAQQRLSTRSRQIPLFRQLEIETSSLCNRYCSSCIRNSHPDREAVASWFEPNLLPQEVFEQACLQAIDLGFRGPLCLQHYNEPLQDPRLVSLGQFAKSLPFAQVFICSNADLLSEAKIQELDGVFDSMQIALYDQSPAQQAKREAKLRAQFKHTRLQFTKGIHIPTHFSPDFDVENLAAAHRQRPCSEPFERLILNHKGQMLLCCDDVVGNFDLGRFPETSLEALWFSETHQALLLALQQAGGREVHPHCLSCPRP